MMELLTVVATTLSLSRPEAICENFEESWHSTPLYTNETMSPVDLLTWKTSPPLVSTTYLPLLVVTPKAAKEVPAKHETRVRIDFIRIMRIN
jgi:hypothetical protein